MQIAKMFASLGFKVDTAGLIVFKKAIADARAELTNLNRSAKNSTRQLRNLKREVNNLSAAMAKIRGTTGSGKVTQAYQSMAGSAHKLNNALNAIVLNRKNITNAIGKINSSVFAGLNHWDRYRTSVVQTRRAILNLNREISRLRANARVRVDINRNGGGGGSGGSGSGGLGGSGAAGGLLAGLGLKGFLANIVPSMAIASVGGGVGYGGKMMVEANRENTRMESMILMTSKSSAEYKDTIDYINKEGLRLGLSVSELGKSFAQISMSAEKLSQTEKKEMFTGFSEFMMSMGTSADDQKGIFRAFNQMFSNNRILQEEINQLSDRGIPATLIYDAAMKEYGLDTVAQVKKLQEAGKLDPSRVLTAMSKSLQAKAHDSGAFDRMKESSIFKQNQFMAEMRKFSVETMSGGLDKQLGNIFGLLTDVLHKIRELVVVLNEFVVVSGEIASYIDKLTNSNRLLQAALFVTLFRFKGFVKGVAIASRVIRTNNGLVKALAAVLRGVLGKAIAGIVLRLGAWGLALYAVSEAVSFLYKEIDKRNKGDWTWFDEMAIRAEVFRLKIQAVIDDMLWFKTFLSSGAMMNAGFGEVVELGTNKTKSLLDPTPYIGKGIKSILELKSGWDKMMKDPVKGDGNNTTPEPVRPPPFSSSVSPYQNRAISIYQDIFVDGVKTKQEVLPFYLNA